MLQGYLVYKTDDGHQVKFKIVARDSFNDFKLQLNIGDTDINPYSEYAYGCEMLDTTVNKEGERVNDYYGIVEFQPVRRLEVKKANKYKSNIVNREFCSKISALIRYSQIMGRKNYSAMDTGEFTDRREVMIDGVGKIIYSCGLMIDIDIHNKYVDLVLSYVDDNTLDEAIFRELKEKDKYGHILSQTPVSNVGFKLSEDLLGFKYTPAVSMETPNILGMYSTIEEVIAANPDKNTDWILKRNYQIVTDEMLDDLFKDFMNSDCMIAFDTETTGLNINFKSRTGEADELVGVVLSKQIGTGYYFPLQHKLFKNLCDGDHWYFMEKYMKPLLENKQIICHNVKFDWKVAHIYDINVNCVYDTMIAFGVTKRYEEESFEMGLKDLAHNILGLDMFDLADFVTSANFGDSDITFADLHYELVRRYAPADADMTLSLYDYIESTDLLTRYNARIIFDLEVWFAKAVAYSEFYGYHIDVDRIPQLTAEIENEMNKHKQNLFAMAGREFNPSSSQQLMTIMYDELGIEQLGEKRTTNKETLKALAGYENPDGSPKYPFVTELKEFRDNESIHKNFLKKLHNFATHDGYIFPEVLQLGTNTGRCSVKNPNYQSYNDVVKHYVCPRPGFMHFDADFAQIEQRVLTSYACIMFPNEPPLALLSDFDDPDMDYHQYQAARMFNVPYAAVTKSMRQQSKGINFGLPYGMGDSSLGARIFGERNSTNTAKAATLRRKFFQGQELIEKFFDTVRAEGVKNNYTSTQFGRRRYYHRSKFTVAEIRRQAGNHVIQGTAADIYKFAVVNLFKRVCKEGWLGKVLFNGFIHDEVLLEVHNSINPYYFMKVWREEFEVKPEHYCRLYAGAGVGYCWYDAKKLDLPPEYIDEIIQEYSEDMPWDGDTDKFLTDIKNNFVRFKTNKVKKYIEDPANNGVIIKPAIWALLPDEIDAIVTKLQAEPEKLVEINKVMLGKVPSEGKCKLKDLQDQLQLFCLYYGVDFNKVNILSPGEVKTETQSEEVVDEIKPVTFTDDSLGSMLRQIVCKQGFWKDYNSKLVYMTDFKFQNGNTVSNYLYSKGHFISSENADDNAFAVISVYCSKDGNEVKSVQQTPYFLNKESFDVVTEAYKMAIRGGAERICV